jgi:hypothetical protein
MTAVSGMDSILVSATRSDRPRVDRISRAVARLVILPMVLCLVTPAHASVQVHQTPHDFVLGAFPGSSPQKKAIWIAGDLKQEVERVMGHQLGLLRVRYWVDGARTAWVLEEVGKVELITVGVVVEAGRIEQLKILVYRESRGWEVRFPFFTNQFRGAQVEGGRHALDRGVENISGATLSVRAVTRLARLALILDRSAEPMNGATDEEGKS